MRVTIYDKNTGRITANMDIPSDAVRLQTAGRKELAHIDGWWPSDRYVIIRGQAVEAHFTSPVADWQVRDEASRRISSHYPMWRQLNILRNGTSDEVRTMGEYIDAVRDASNALDPAPQDYTDDKHWPSLDEPTRTL